MQHFLYAEINIACIIILMIMLLNMNGRLHNHPPLDQKIFNGMLLVNVLACLFDTGMWVFDGSSTDIGRYFNLISTVCYYVMNPLLCFLWLAYTDYKVHENVISLRKHLRFYTIPVLITTIMALLSPFTSWFFHIDSYNNYSRGTLFIVMAGLSLYYLVHSLIITFIGVYQNGWKENKHEYFYLIFLPIWIIGVSIIQSLYFGLSIIWVCSMLALLLLYINMQNLENSTDQLTGLYNRRRFETFLRLKMKNTEENHILFNLILDLNDFKVINDTFGHVVGDKALISTAKLLRRACRYQEDFIARTGGDEFVIIGERRNQKEIDELVEKIKEEFTLFNKTKKVVYQLSGSMGYAVFEIGETSDTFISRADLGMYQDKQVYKQKKLNQNNRV